MSLGQLTANYTDSEGEGSEVASDNEGESERTDAGKVSGSQNTSPVPGVARKVNRLVSYYNEDEDEDPADMDEEEPDELLNPEPMDTETDEGEEEQVLEQHPYGIALPSAPIGKCNVKLQDKVIKIVTDVRRGAKDYNSIIQKQKEFRNPSIYEKLIDLLQLDEMGSNFPLEVFDAHCWSKESFYDNLARVQKEEMEKRERERKEKTKVDVWAGTKKPMEEEKKRKSRFDQIAPGGLSASLVAVPALATVSASNKKATIDAFGALKKAK